MSQNEYRITVKCTYSKLNEILESMDEPNVYVNYTEELVNGNFQSIGLDE